MCHNGGGSSLYGPIESQGWENYEHGGYKTLRGRSYDETVILYAGDRLESIRVPKGAPAAVSHTQTVRNQCSAIS